MSKVGDFTFKETTNLFNEKVLMVLRNKDKRYIASLGLEHFEEMICEGYNCEDNEHILQFLEDRKYL